MSGTLFGVGLGPGDPELVTVKAARVIGAADVVAYHSARHGRSIARRIAEPYLRSGQIEEHLVYPVTTETTDHPGGYAGAMEDFYCAAADRLAAHREAGRDVALLIGGPDGLDAPLKATADETLRLSDLTLPHALARVLLAEALYRAWSVTTGHPYHRE